MASELTIDSAGFNKMIRELKKYTGARTRNIVRSVTQDILLSTASKTKTSSLKAVKESVKKNLRKPFQNPQGDGKYHLTKAGRIWVSPSDEKTKKSWILIKEGVTVPIKNMPEMVLYSKKAKKKRRISKANGDYQRAKQVIGEARKFYDKEIAYRRKMIGLGQASFIKLGRMLKLKMPRKRGIKQNSFVLANKLPRNTRLALNAFENMKSRDDYAIILRSTVQAALNPKSKGLIAFKLALNGNVKNYQRRTQEDAKGYAKQFAKRHGFTVR